MKLMTLFALPVLGCMLGCSPDGTPQSGQSTASPPPAAAADPQAPTPASQLVSGTTPATGAPAPGGEAPEGLPAASPGPASPPPAAAAAGALAARSVDRKSMEYREVTIPAGTTLSIVLETPVASDTSNVEDPVRGRLRRAIVVNGVAAIPAEAPISGNVTAANRSAKVKGRASIAFRLDAVRVGDEPVAISTAQVSRLAPATKKEDAKKIGIGAAGGAILGAIVGGKKGAGIGTAVGAGAGSGVVLATRGEEVRLPAGAVVTTTLLSPVTVQVPLSPR